MVLMVMSNQNLIDFVAFLAREFENCVHVPRRIDHGRLMRLGVADQVDEVRHRTDLRLPQV